MLKVYFLRICTEGKRGDETPISVSCILRCVRKCHVSHGMVFRKVEWGNLNSKNWRGRLNGEKVT